ncbi:MAG: DUF169 domain-containing protein [Desulfobacterales bacterium]|nr:MAG: DUF169 domain-containing protein [Desulfobacterales bacterium]
MKVNLTEFDEALNQHVRPDSFPVAVRMVTPGDSLPERVKHPLRDLKIKIAICQAIAMARRYGWVLAVGKEDISCPLGAAVFGFKKASKYYHEGQACEGMYSETVEGGKLSEARVEKYAYNEFQYILVAPLHRTVFNPQVVVIYASPAQVLRLLTATLWKSGGHMTSSFGGRIDCAEEIIVPQRTGNCELILPCYGDRIFAQTQDHEMAFAVPINRVEEIIEGLTGTHKGGIRYPIPSFLRYTGEFPSQYNKATE